MLIPTVDGHSDESLGNSMKDPINQPQRTLKVIVIGAGASGLLVAYKLQRHFDNLDLRVFEKHPAVSGVWFENVRTFFTEAFLGIKNLLIACRRIQDVPATSLLTVRELEDICIVNGS